jgi:hypothetical protein
MTRQLLPLRRWTHLSAEVVDAQPRLALGEEKSRVGEKLWVDLDVSGLRRAKLACREDQLLPSAL